MQFKFKSAKIKGNKIIESIAFALYSIALLILFVALININIVQNFDDKIYSLDRLNEITEDKYDCILILGAGVRADGTPTPMLRDRLLTGYEAYINNTDAKIFLSGDSEHDNYRETDAMKSYLLSLGVPEKNIICDGYGLSTYESIWRANNVYGYYNILIVSQKYHLYRALYISNELGINAYGLDGALELYGKQPYYTAREYLARIKDVFYAELNPDPYYTEKWVE